MTIKQLSRGDYVLIKPVPAFVMEAAAAAVPDPEVPIWTDPETGEKIPHYDSPAYALAVERANKRREMAAVEAMIAFSLTLVNQAGDPIDPPDDGWDVLMEVLGIKVPKDPVARRLTYLTKVAVSPPDLQEIMKEVGVSNVAAAEATFQGN